MLGLIQWFTNGCPCSTFLGSATSHSLEWLLFRVHFFILVCLCTCCYFISLLLATQSKGRGLRYPFGAPHNANKFEFSFIACAASPFTLAFCTVIKPCVETSEAYNMHINTCELPPFLCAVPMGMEAK